MTESRIMYLIVVLTLLMIVAVFFWLGWDMRMEEKCIGVVSLECEKIREGL